MLDWIWHWLVLTRHPERTSDHDRCILPFAWHPANTLLWLNGRSLTAKVRDRVDKREVSKESPRSCRVPSFSTRRPWDPPLPTNCMAAVHKRDVIVNHTSYGARSPYEQNRASLRLINVELKSRPRRRSLFSRESLKSALVDKNSSSLSLSLSSS